MKSLREITKDIQRIVGVEVDGVFGPITAAAVLRDLNVLDSMEASEPEQAVAEEWEKGLDARTIANISTLDPKCRERFAQFTRLAKATAATLGGDYVMISGNRTFAEQDELYAQGRTNPGNRVTNARGGYSNHNFGIAGDYGVFRGKLYLDGSAPETAAKVHKACSVHAKACGLEWGGTWAGFKDLPHYEVGTGLSLATKRKLMNEKGSVL